MNTKRYLLLLVCIVLLVIWAIYPTQSKVLYGRLYDIDQKVLNENISFEITPSQYSKEDQEYTDNKSIYKYEGSEILLNKIVVHKDYIDILIGIDTKWDMFEGTSLSVNLVNKNPNTEATNIETSLTHIKFKIADDEGNNIDAESGVHSIENILLRINNKEDFYNAEKISIELQGFLKTEYKLQLFN